jgi:hypothetical protein
MIDKSIVPLMGENGGKFVAKLDKALYAMYSISKAMVRQVDGGASHLWFYWQNPCDECVMNKTAQWKADHCRVFRVDDLLIPCEGDHTIDGVISHLRSSFREVKEKKDNTMGCLGMRLSIREEGVYVDMNAYTNKVLNEFGAGGNASTHATGDLFNDRDAPLLLDVDRNVFT